MGEDDITRVGQLTAEHLQRTVTIGTGNETATGKLIRLSHYDQDGTHTGITLVILGAELTAHVRPNVDAQVLADI